jgi:hypothetical protein
VRRQGAGGCGPSRININLSTGIVIGIGRNIEVEPLERALTAPSRSKSQGSILSA